MRPYYEHAGITIYHGDCRDVIELMSWCLSQFPETASIFDPFLGTGTSLAEAKRLRITGVGIEREERYCEIAAKRLAQEALPLSFDPAPLPL